MNDNTKLKINTLLAGVLTLLPVSAPLIGLIESIIPNIYIGVYIFAFYAIKIIGFIIYFFYIKKVTKPRIILTIIANIFLLFNGIMFYKMNNMEGHGIDSIGEALTLGIIFNICLYIYYFFTFIIFILYSKDLIKNKK